MLFFKAKVRRVKFWWNLSFAYFSRYRFWLLASLLLFSSLIFTFYKLLPTIMRTNLITLGYVGIYTIETIPTEVLSLATQSFVSSGSDGKPIPSLASHWTVSDDGKTYVVFLKDNLFWGNGESVDAKDISIAISDVSVKALNNKAIEFKLPNPVFSFPLALAKPIFKTKSFYGTGHFLIVDIDKVGDVVKKITLAPRDETLPRVDIKFYQTEEQAINALKIGEVKNALVANADIFEKWPNVEVKREMEADEVVTIFYNNEDSLLSSKEIRQALTFSINRTQFDGVLASAPIAPTSWVYNSHVKKYEYNTGRSKALLSKASGELKITLSVSPGLEEIAQMIKGDWEAVGVETSLRVEKSVPVDFQALLAINQLKPDPDQYALWHSTQRKTNITRYKNVKIDKLLEDARVEKDENKRMELYFDFQRFLVEDAPAAFLYHPYKYQVTYKNAKKL